MLCACGERVVTDVIPATGHHFSEWVTERQPTATLEGLAVRRCPDCGFSESKTLLRQAPTYSYRQVTATVGAVLNGGYYYCLDGQYCEITAKTSTDTEGDWRSIVTYYANETLLGEQIIPFMSYDDSCSLSPIYSLFED